MDSYPRIVGPWTAHLPKILQKPTVDLDGWLESRDDYWWYQYKIHAHVDGYGVMHGTVNYLSRILSYSLDGEPTVLRRFHHTPDCTSLYTESVNNYYCMLTITPGWKVKHVYYRQHFPYPTTLNAEVKQ